MIIKIEEYKKSIEGKTNNKVIIVGKNCNLDDYLPLSFNSDDIVVCLNGAINLVDRCDWWVANEYNAIPDLNENGKSNLKNAFIPEYPRYEPYGFNGKIYTDFITDLSVNCNCILYDGFWMPNKNKSLFDPGVVISVGDTALAFMIELGYRNFEFYGIGVDWRYTKMFYKSGPTPTWQLKMVYDAIINRCNNAGATYKFNFSKKNLESIYDKYKIEEDTGMADKGTVHSYIPVYSKLFERYRCESNIMEIGINRGHSIKMWGEYFIDSKIVGVDIHNGIDMNDFLDDKYRIIISDATKPEFIDEIKDMKFDIIIDDGDHIVDSQIKSFNILKNKMNKGGLYIIEDVRDIELHNNTYMKMHDKVEIVDLRKIKNRFDDVLVIFKF